MTAKNKELSQSFEKEKLKTRRIEIATTENKAMKCEVAGLERRTLAATNLLVKSVAAIKADLSAEEENEREREILIEQLAAENCNLRALLGISAKETEEEIFESTDIFLS